MNNLSMSKQQLKQIRSLPDFDLIMILSDIHEHGCYEARKTLQQAIKALSKRGPTGRDEQLWNDLNDCLPELEKEFPDAFCKPIRPIKNSDKKGKK